MPVPVLDDHLAACAGCAEWAGEAARVTRRARLASAPAVPDLTAAVLGALPRELPGRPPPPVPVSRTPHCAWRSWPSGSPRRSSPGRC
ncbi:hypothetical protein [Blastococcus brunescens]|uniref:Zinc-finger domain-containing protein n=1 Tax=Blastococcus brunescens TaxID=1564165 RepID=A0ABZ1B2W6_9ACTN|nr:hypothetical protein [Blastococcus sp. BMG 8361]WRL65084.1 hypothetical protein U6N30_05175 [Blastococcus sp. BMG 8361]